MIAGSLARLPLRLIPKSATLPILSGPNRGMRWIVGAGQHGCWLGNYENFCVNFITAQISPGTTVFDVGAHAGYYTLMFSRRVGPSGKVFAFEGNRINADNLRRHIEINRITNTEVIEAAVSDRDGTGHFSDTGYTGRLAPVGRSVRTVRLDDFPTPDFVKMDIEGGECLALRGAEGLIGARKTTWFVATHGTDAECRNCLADLNVQTAGPNELLAR